MKLDLRGCSGVTEFPEVSENVESLLLGETAIEQVPSSVEHLTKLSQLSLRNCTRLKSVSRGIFRLQFMSELSLEGCSKLDNLAIEDDQVVPSSSINELLPRLSRLDMRYCNNIESFPIMFCNLRSLYRLDLAGYSGVDKMLESLPISSLSSLCSLESLNLSECNLLVLPSALRYLSSLTSLDAHNCISLETLPTANVVFTGNWNSQQKYIFFNCFNLDDNARINIMEDARLRSQLMANNTQRTASTENYPGTRLSSHSVCFPGNEIPEWISDQNEGSSLIIDLPPNWYSNKFFGFTTCIVATFEGNSYDSLFFVQWICKFIDHDDESHGILCHVDYETVGQPNSDHVLLATPHCDLFDVYEGGDDIYGDSNTSSLEKFSSCKKALFRFSVVDTELYTLPNCKVKKCGVGLLYAEDIESIQRYDHDNSGDDQTAESGRDGISNEEEEDPNLEPEVDDEHWNCSFGNCFSFLFQRWS
ncbi:hypothetical protein LWI29_029884 [Acer saccharum]|uniref:C-JID domain-containing protein n=1 Tax=Acer saccharum TaxID=4024 RepID=A0AA39VWE8_ACESA|nr:hypothetical protein LWI29_029884 [Acer saccharum]